MPAESPGDEGTEDYGRAGGEVVAQQLHRLGQQVKQRTPGQRTRGIHNPSGGSARIRSEGNAPGHTSRNS